MYWCYSGYFSQKIRVLIAKSYILMMQLFVTHLTDHLPYITFGDMFSKSRLAFMYCRNGIKTFYDIILRTVVKVIDELGRYNL